jgi:hypothetical protein
MVVFKPYALCGKKTTEILGFLGVFLGVKSG